MDEGIRCRTQLRKVYADRKTHNYGSAANFAETMRNYVNEYRKWEHAYHAMHSAQQQQFPNSQGLNNINQPIRGIYIGRIGNGAAQNNNANVTTFEPASIVRRVIAEAIDFAICLVLKLILVLFLIEMDWIDISPYQKVIDEEHDIVEFIIMTQSLLPLEVVCKFVCALLEGLIMSINIGPCRKGQTPGKYIVGIRVIAAEQVTDSPVIGNVQLHGPSEISFKQAITRAFLKNVVVNSLFPLSTAIFNLSATRSFYDSLLKTIVVIG